MYTALQSFTFSLTLLACNVGDEGGFAPNILQNDEGLSLCNTAIEKAGYTGKIQIGMDVAASEFCKDKMYDLDFKNKDSKKEDWVSFTLFNEGAYLTDMPIYQKVLNKF